VAIKQACQQTACLTQLLSDATTITQQQGRFAANCTADCTADHMQQAKQPCASEEMHHKL